MRKINIIGYGIMGKQIVSMFSLLGYEVHLWNHNLPDLNLLQPLLSKNQENFGSKNGQIIIHKDLCDLPDNLTIEAALEDITVKRSIYNVLKNKITKGYFTNTSSFSPGEIDCNIGVLHFFNPIKMKFVEYLPSRENNAEVEALIIELEALNFVIAKVKDNRCFLGNFILFHEFSAFFKLLEKHNYPYMEVEKVVSKLYGNRDILKIVDIIGIDVTLKIMQNIQESEPSFFVPSILSLAIQNNILGYKNKTSIKDYLSIYQLLPRK